MNLRNTVEACNKDFFSRRDPGEFLIVKVFLRRSQGLVEIPYDMAPRRAAWRRQAPDRARSAEGRRRSPRCAAAPSAPGKNSLAQASPTAGAASRQGGPRGVVDPLLLLPPPASRAGGGRGSGRRRKAEGGGAPLPPPLLLPLPASRSREVRAPQGRPPAPAGGLGAAGYYIISL